MINNYVKANLPVLQPQHQIDVNRHLPFLATLTFRNRAFEQQAQCALKQVIFYL